MTKQKVRSWRGNRWFAVLALLALVTMSSTLLPSSTPGDCPPINPSDPDLKALLDSCGNWVCGVTYDPAQGFLPQDDPATPWDTYIAMDSQVSLPNGTLLIEGSGLLGDDSAAEFRRVESALEQPENWLYLIQASYQADDIDDPPPLSQTIAVIGASDTTRAPVFSLGYQNSDRGVVIGESDDPGSSEYWYSWDWGIETLYTYVVQKEADTYLLINGELVLTRPYDTIEPLDFPLLGLFVFTSGDVIGEYSRIQYCICGSDLIYKNKTVDTSPVMVDLPSEDGLFTLTRLTDVNDPFFNGQYTNPETFEVRMLIDVPDLPGGDVQYEIKLKLRVDSLETGKKVHKDRTYTLVEGANIYEGLVSWNGDDDGSQLPVPSGPYVYRIIVELTQTALSTGELRVLDTLKTNWRLVTVE